MTQKNKNIILIAGFLLVLVLSYRMAFTKTISVHREVKSLKEETVTFESLAGMSATLSAREKFADSVLRKNNIRNSSIQNNLLELLNRESGEKHFIITEFNEPHTFTENGATITSYRFTLRGEFNAMQDVLYMLEQKYNFGKVSHVHFYKKKDYRKRKDYLLCTIIMESILSKQPS